VQCTDDQARRLRVTLLNTDAAQFLLKLTAATVLSSTTEVVPQILRRKMCSIDSDAESILKMKGVSVHIPFSFIDVFADGPLTGNPLAVVPDSEHLDDLTMQRIANEFNQAETTFILSARHKSAERRLRSVTASGHEIFGAGHNSLGAWWWLAESGQLKLADGPNHFLQEIGESLLPVEIRCEAHQVVSVVLTQSSPIYGTVCKDLVGLTEALGLDTGEIGHDLLPIQVVSTGAPHLLVPVRDRVD
jgi:trans-2,3-dihydro-3-hydroxyanthranilate isomerase